MRTTYRVLAYLIVLGVMYQAAVVAFGTFGFINELNAGTTFTGAVDPPNAGPVLHAIGGTIVIPALTLLLVVASFFAKVKGGIRWALLVLLAVVVQVNLGFFAFELPAIGLLHGVNAFAIVALALIAARAAGQAPAAQPAASTTASSAAPTGV
jgi:hypothetical protein